MIIKYNEIEIIGGTRLFECYYSGRPCYGVEQISTGCKAVFNHNRRILNAIEAVLMNDGNIARNSRNNMYLYHKGKRLKSLGAYLYCLYVGINPEIELANNIRHKRKRRNNLIEDCTKNNLYMGGVSVLLDESNNSLLISSNTKDYIDELEPVPLLADIMNIKNFVMYWNNTGRLMCHIKGRFGFPVADLAYLAYYDNLTMDNFIDKLLELKQYKRDNGLSIEHLDSNYHNHRKYNIALVDEGMNRKKCDRILHIKEPYFFTAVMSDGKYKIVLGRADEDLILDSSLFMTEHFENVVGLLLVYQDLYPDIFNKAEAKANNKVLFFDRKFCEAIANTPDKHFKNLDDLTPVEGT